MWCGVTGVRGLVQGALVPIVTGRHSHSGDDDAHHEAGLVEIIRIFVKDTVFGLRIVHKRKNHFANNLWIFALRPLVVVFTRKTRPKFWLAFNEVVSLAFTDRGRVAFA